MSPPADVKDLLTSGALTACHYANGNRRRAAARPDCDGLATVAYRPIALCASCDTRRSAVGNGTAPRQLPDPAATAAVAAVADGDRRRPPRRSSLVGHRRRLGHHPPSRPATLHPLRVTPDRPTPPMSTLARHLAIVITLSVLVAPPANRAWHPSFSRRLPSPPAHRAPSTTPRARSPPPQQRRPPDDRDPPIRHQPPTHPPPPPQPPPPEPRSPGRRPTTNP